MEDMDDILEEISQWTDAEVRDALLHSLRENEGATLRALMSACSKNRDEWSKTLLDILRRCPDLQDLLPH
jgi:hypothetical protein